jgi:hypothetical protein
LCLVSEYSFLGFVVVFGCGWFGFGVCSLCSDLSHCQTLETNNNNKKVVSLYVGCWLASDLGGSSTDLRKS